jgi:hypothetical protein
MEIEEIKLIILGRKNCSSCTCIVGTSNKLEKRGGGTRSKGHIQHNSIGSIDIYRLGYFFVD